MKLNAFVSARILTVGAVLLISGCTIPLPNGTVPSASTDAPVEAATDSPAPVTDGAMATVNTRSLRVRQSPDETSEVVAGIAAGETYRVLSLSEDGLWVELAINSAVDGSGWVSTNFVTVEGDVTGLTPEAAVPAASQPVTGTAGVTLVATPQPGFALVNTGETRLRVRGGPSTNDPIVGYAYNGETYAVLETSEDGTWVRIPAATGSNIDNAQGGWVAAEFLLINP